jgi:hypothetical protein
MNTLLESEEFNIQIEKMGGLFVLLKSVRHGYKSNLKKRLK